MTPDLSVIIPVYNRGDVIRYTLESVRRASAGLNVETIVVDDGSTPPTADTLTRLSFAPSVLVRQNNQGLLFARLAGFARATAMSSAADPALNWARTTSMMGTSAKRAIGAKSRSVS